MNRWPLYAGDALNGRENDIRSRGFRQDGDEQSLNEYVRERWVGRVGNYPRVMWHSSL
jgi:hypothetical protein